MGEDRWLVVGLGNPGPQYAGNRHNAGFMVADLLAARIGGGFRSEKTRAQVLTGRIGDSPIVLAKPMTYMNLSGGPVKAIQTYYKIPTDHVVVIHDELDLPFGTLRLKQGGGAGGHNGLRSLITSLNSPDFLRVRFGIGRPPGRMDAADFVLRDFSSAERKELDVLLEHSADAVEDLVVHGLSAAQNSHHAQ